MSLLNTIRDGVRSFVADAGFWSNVTLGIGDTRDPSRNWRFTGDVCEIDQEQLEALWNYNPVARRICNAIIEDGLRQGYEAPGENAEALYKADRKKAASRAVAKAAKWGRAFGGSAIIVDTGEAFDLPLPPAIQPGSLKRFLVRGRRDITPEYPYDIEGGAEYYTIQPVQGGQPIRVHRTRLQLFLGGETTLQLRIKRQGFGISELEVVYNTMRSNAAQYDASDRIMQDLSQAVFKLHGVVDALSDDSGAQAEGFLARVRAMDRARGLANAVVLDADQNESFEQVGRANAGGIPAVLDKSDQRLAMAAGMPVTRLMGISPGGLNATGDSDIRGWYDNVQSYREEHVQPVLEWALRLVAQDGGLPVSEDEDLITWPSLWQRTPVEEDDRKVKLAGLYGALAQQGLLLPEEATRALLETGAFPEVELDEAKRGEKEALANALRAQLAANGPPGVNTGSEDPSSAEQPNQPPGRPTEKDPSNDKAP